MNQPTAFEQASIMWKRNAEVLQNLDRIVPPQTYQALYELILSCKGRIATMGMGTSSVAARKIAHMLCVANMPSFFVSAGDAAHGALGSVQEEDIVIAVTKGGNTEELVNLIDSLKQKRVTLVAVTQNPESQLALAADLVLQLSIEESDHKRMLPTASILCIIAIFDALADELTKRPEFTEEIFYLNHNHGAVGSLLKDKIDKENK